MVITLPIISFPLLYFRVIFANLFGKFGYPHITEEITETRKEITHRLSIGRDDAILHMTSDPSQLIIGERRTGIEIPDDFVDIPFRERGAKPIMSVENIVEDYRRQRKNYITGVKVAIDSETHDAGGGLISPFFKNLGRVELRPQEVLEAKHFRDTEICHFFSLFLRGDPEAASGLTYHLKENIRKTAQISPSDFTSVSM